MPARFVTGDRVVVVPAPDSAFATALRGRGGTIVIVNDERELAGVMLEQGTVHAMPWACLRRVRAPRES
jgi:hypothetical protein